ncbi:hypothetical protein GE09DRAFT_1060536 [Coniochaeta sp. 2T2.1]|nr:hypothetical protein GE09DRAFT_1060536 [Coniochaeta sp. 2T2.1]
MDELADLSGKLQTFLDMVHRSPLTDEAQKEILRFVLSYCGNRVKGYLNALERHLKACIQATLRNNQPECLQNVTEEALTTARRDCEINIPATERLIWSVYRAYKSPVFELVQKRGQEEERHKSSTDWTNLIHVTGRLMTYKQAIDVAFMVRKQWPELFEDFDITMVPSSATAAQALNKRVMTTREIIHKTTQDEQKLVQLYAAAERTENFRSIRLDQEIEKEWSKKPKNGIGIHAEINLLLYLEQTEGGTHENRFFEGIKFIGSSKPPCKLCSYFFREYPTDVQVRPSHDNLYGAWLMPDLGHRAQPSQGETLTQKIARKIRDRLRDDDLLEALRGGEIGGRLHDSSNYSTRRGQQSNDRWEETSARTEVSSLTHDPEADETESTGVAPDKEDAIDNTRVLSYIRAQASLESITHDIGSLNLQSDRRQEVAVLGTPTIRFRGTVQKPSNTIPVPDSDEEDGGGTLLFQGRANMRNGVRRH